MLAERRLGTHLPAIAPERETGMQWLDAHTTSRGVNDFGLCAARPVAAFT
jgi:hypothetical protein